MSILYTLPINRLAAFLPNEGEPPETFFVRMDNWIAKGDYHPEVRLVVLESSVGERFAVNFPREVVLANKVVFIRDGKESRIKSVLEIYFGKLSLLNVEYSGPDELKMLRVTEYLLYELKDGGRWELIEYDGNKIPK